MMSQATRLLARTQQIYSRGRSRTPHVALVSTVEACSTRAALKLRRLSAWCLYCVELSALYSLTCDLGGKDILRRFVHSPTRERTPLRSEVERESRVARRPPPGTKATSRDRARAPGGTDHTALDAASPLGRKGLWRHIDRDTVNLCTNQHVCAISDRHTTPQWSRSECQCETILTNPVRGASGRG